MSTTSGGLPVRPGMTVPLPGPLHSHREKLGELADLGYTDIWSAESDGARRTVAAIVILAVAKRAGMVAMVKSLVSTDGNSAQLTGADTGKAKLEAAAKHGVTVIDEAELEKLLE